MIRITDVRGSITQHQYISKAVEGGAPQAMSTIEEVRAAEKRVEQVLAALKNARDKDSNNLAFELMDATDEYARAVRELSSK